MAIKVCDAIMGSGKSSAAIKYMNDHPEQRFIYITPYLEEVDRIKTSCPRLHFQEPSNKIPACGFRKCNHAVELLLDGRNVASTHSLFLRHSNEMVDAIKKHEYTLIIDEALDTFSKAEKVSQCDIARLERYGDLIRNGELLTTSDTCDYTEGELLQIIERARGGRLVEMRRGDTSSQFYCWEFAVDVITAFKDVIIMTYLFDAQDMKYYMDIFGLQYDYIGVCKNDAGDYEFCEPGRWMPSYANNLSGKIHIIDNAKLNAIGEDRCALSSTYFSNRFPEDRKKALHNNVQNFFMHYNPGTYEQDRLWATYEACEKYIRDKGYSRRSIAFNARATNKYKDASVLAYCVNVFLDGDKKRYLSSKGINVQEDEYALSVMLQWIWRSAIRDGKPISIYIPSRRMRTLLKEWIARVEAEYARIQEASAA